MSNFQGPTEPPLPGPLRPRGSPRALARLAFGSIDVEAHAVAGADHETVAPSLPDALIPDPQRGVRPRFGDYELLELISEGGMGVVYRARQISLDREVALKLLSAGIWASGRFVERFRAEARNAARLQHPNIVAIHEFGAHDEINFLAMRLVVGRSLAQELADGGPFAPRRAAQLLRTIAEALDFAHRLGVLHLDLKPANVLIDEHGEPQVADFGLARRLEEVPVDGSDQEISGTPNYMAPEQAQPGRGKLSAASDIHGLGAILYELLTGVPPFLGTTRRETLQRVANELPAPPRHLRQGVPPDLDAVCMKCLQKDPHNRYRTARQLADDLGRFLEQRAVSVRPLNMPQRMLRWMRREPRVAALLAAFFAALVIGLAATTGQRRIAEENGRRAEDNATQARQRLWASRLDGAWRALREHGPSAALPAVVTNLAEQEQVGDAAAAARSRVRVASLLAQGPQLTDLIATGGTIYAIELDRAGHWVASLDDDGNVRCFDLTTGQERWRAGTQGRPEFIPNHGSPDALTATTRGDALILWQIDAPRNTNYPVPKGLDETLIDISDGHVWLPPRDRFPGLITTSYSHDGDAVLVLSRPRPDKPPQVQLLHSRDWRPLSPVRTAKLEPPGIVGPGGRHVARLSDDYRHFELLDGATLQPQFTLDEPDGAGFAAWRFSLDGRQLALAGGHGRISLLDTESGTWRPLQSNGDHVRLIEFSDDDSWVAASYIDGSVRVWSVASGELVGDPIRMPPQSGEHEYGQMDRLVPDPVTGTVFVSDWPDGIAWAVPHDARASELILRRPQQARRVAPTATAFRPAIGLLAAGAQDGEIRIWRTRTNAVEPYRAAPLVVLPGNEPGYDGSHLLRVAGREVQVIDRRTRSPASIAFVHDQDVAFAELVACTPWLVTTTGRRLHRYDWRAGRELEPIDLEATPDAVTMVNGEALVVRLNGYESGANVEYLESYAIESGARIGRVAFADHISFAQHSADGSRLIVTEPRRVRLFDAVSLAEQPLGPGANVEPSPLAFAGSSRIYAMLGRSGRTLWLASVFGTPVLALDVASGNVSGRWMPAGDVEAMQPIGDGDRLALLTFGYEATPILSRDGRVTTVPAPNANGVGGFAASPDGARFAMARTNGLIVFDTASNEWLTPPIDFALKRNDAVVGMTFDGSGGELRVRTFQRHWAQLSLTSDSRPVGELLEIANSLSRPPGTMDRAYAPAMDPARRAALRAEDPGPPAAPAATEVETATPRAAYEPRFVDLRPDCNRRADQRDGRTFQIDRVLPAGRQRLLGVDYEVDCGVLADVAGIRTALPAVRALNVLMAGNGALRNPRVAPYAYLDLHYRDGSTERLTINYREHVVESFKYTMEGDSAHRAYTAAGSWGGPQLFSARFDNPHPERDLVGFDWRAAEEPWSDPMLLAITLEPADRVDAAGAPD